MPVTQQCLTNDSQLPLSLAVWLSDDPYDYIDEPNYISVTTLIKSPRQIILGSRMSPNKERKDVADAMASRFGSAVHGSIEDVWVNRYREALMRLNYPSSVIDRIRVNPEPHELVPGIIPVYLELRTIRKVGKYTIGGKFDFIGDGCLEDFKTTGVYSYMSGSNEWKYKLQGSLYRWLNPEIITSDHMKIQFIFTDWNKNEARYKANKGYPQKRMHEHKILLTSLPETEVWVQQKITLLDLLWEAPEQELPLCEAHHLWQDAPTYKYYKNPAKTTRSTANFNTMAEAQIRLIEDGSIGIIKEVAGTCKGCMYCDAFSLCSQKDALIASGSLKLES